ncbi:MAG: thiaminase/transcriptional activator TenA [Candidatus Azotimanducaceae bacterium]|jgi:thiaminase/transcriptional activator TenA
MNFTDQLWTKIEPIYDAVMDLAFIRELTDGSLSEDIFMFYLQQDSLYLADFSRALSLAAVRSQQGDQMARFLGFAGGVVSVEQDLHNSFFERYQVELTAEKSPSCFAYTHFLLSTALTRDHAVNVAALLPCFWIYREVGLEIHKRAGANNPYQDWIDTYAGEAFNNSVDQAIEITNELAATETFEGLAEMERVFVKSTELEWMFWESAYRKEKWPLELIG